MRVAHVGGGGSAAGSRCRRGVGAQRRGGRSPAGRVGSERAGGEKRQGAVGDPVGTIHLRHDRHPDRGCCGLGLPRRLRGFHSHSGHNRAQRRSGLRPGVPGGEGDVREVSARELVPGDVVLLEAGNLVPADGRLLQETGLRVQESSLTGEAEPVQKAPAALGEEDLPLGERAGMVYSSTVVAMGRGLFVVTETGMATELGKIASMIQTAGQEQTPLQRRLNRVGKLLALVALAIVGVVFALGLLRGEDLEVMFLTAVSLAVAAVPEGLPAVVTIALALGAHRMFRRRALIRKLPAVETLGSVTVICSDKTGTLTQNRMTATVLDVAGRTAALAGGGQATQV